MHAVAVSMARRLHAESSRKDHPRLRPRQPRPPPHPRRRRPRLRPPPHPHPPRAAIAQDVAVEEVGRGSPSSSSSSSSVEGLARTGTASRIPNPRLGLRSHRSSRRAPSLTKSGGARSTARSREVQIWSAQSTRAPRRTPRRLERFESTYASRWRQWQAARRSRGADGGGASGGGWQGVIQRGGSYQFSGMLWSPLDARLFR